MRSREIDILPDYENVDILLGEHNSISIRRELENVINNSVDHEDYETNPTPRQNSSRVDPPWIS